MTLKKLFNWLLFALVVSTVYGCGMGERPFLVLQLCVRDQQGLDEFEELMKSLARSERMKFIDSQVTVQKQLEAIQRRDPTRGYTKPVIYLDVEGDDGVGLTAGNLGLHSYQIAVGFSEGRNPEKARKFANKVTEALSDRWPIETVPIGRGASPMENCGDASADEVPKKFTPADR